MTQRSRPFDLDSELYTKISFWTFFCGLGHFCFTTHLVLKKVMMIRILFKSRHNDNVPNGKVFLLSSFERGVMYFNFPLIKKNTNRVVKMFYTIKL